MSAISDKIKTAQDKDGMLRRALERIIQLYTDKSHFVYELLQNAEDCEATSIKFVQYADRLEVYHDGKPFTAENLQGLCDIGKSDKVDNLNQIGEFGVGFKSVFGICDTVFLYSNPDCYKGKTAANAGPFAVEICDFTRPEDIADESIDGDYTTKFVFPYTVGRPFSGFNSIEKLNAVLSQKLQNLGITTLLFMKHLELIEYQIHIDGSVTEGEYLLQKVPVNSHCSLVSALGISDAGKGNESKDEEISYLKFSRQIDDQSGRTVDIAFPVAITKDGQYDCQRPKSPYVSVYFPTETESKLNFIVQGPYRTTPNRSSIPSDEPDNIMLAEETATLLHDSLIELRDAGKLNMSFVKALPVSESAFSSFDLFQPLYDTVVELFSNDSIIPCKDGGYTRAEYAKIARQEKLAQLLPDSLLSQLENDGHAYHWLPTFLTETNREYEQVYRFLNYDLDISVIRPEDLRQLFAANPEFLPQMSETWIVSLYTILENIGAAFSKSGSANMLTADIIKTTKGEFVAPYRRTDGRQYIPNVFLPSEKVRNDDIHFVDGSLYKQCRHFFDDILELQKPNEYECQIKDIKKRYPGEYVFDEEQHICDTKFILKYLKYDDYKDEVQRLIKECFLLRCSDGCMRSTYSEHIYVPMTSEGINIEGYFRNINASAHYIDAEFYANHDISLGDLATFGVKDSIVMGEAITHGMYYNGARGRQPEWSTYSDFRWKLSIDGIKDALKYISTHPSAKDSILKSQAIFRVLLLNEKRLRGHVFISGSTQSLDNEPCELLKILRGESFFGWDGKWLFTEDGELVSQKNVSKHDISESIYGKLKPESSIYEFLGFTKTDDDTVDDLKKKVPETQLDAYFETELKIRFGITTADLDERYGSYSSPVTPVDTEETYPFPTSFVKNWETLRKHAAEMLCYANPVRYEYAVRHIRVSNNAKEAKAYLHNMYRYDGIYKYACQACHESCGSIEIAQVFNNPETELDPMNLCLCPTCASRYRLLRNNDAIMAEAKKRILSSSESSHAGMGYVSLPIGDMDIWFTQTHFAEIQELLRLEDEVKQTNDQQPDKTVSVTEPEEQSGLAVYEGYVGKYIYRKQDGFGGVITKVDDKAIFVAVDAGKDKGQTKQIMLEFLLKSLNSPHPIYELRNSK